MKKEFTDTVIKDLESCSPQEVAVFFRDVKSYVTDRLQKHVDSWQSMAKEMGEYIDTTIKNKG